ncbi:alpha-2,8-sialyltransferase 8F [Amia ocellicauda]|uniref:alpha-2,8-sialyltransferase 8F n=1 Tax=Amia ocellicauda TaxID=2972642 RepID=UPI003463FA7E
MKTWPRVCLSLLLALGVVLYLVSPHLSLGSYNRGRQVAGSTEAVLRCTQIRDKIQRKSALNEGNSTVFSSDVTKLMSCPWTANPTLQERLRSVLRSCCDAQQNLSLTQKNTRLGQRLHYEVNRTIWRQVDQELFEMLPQSSLFRAGLSRCAVVGNGGILKNSNCGAEIDRADYIIRINLPPLAQSAADVGLKTSLVSANPSQINNVYRRLSYERRPFVDTVSSFGLAPLLLPAFVFPHCTEPCVRAFYSLLELRPQQRALFFSPQYLRQLALYWQRQGLHPVRLSTGMMLASVALELCDHVHLYGFWPFPFDLSRRPLSHHYFDDVGPKPGAHMMAEEFLKLLQLHSQGALQLHLGPCP